MTQTVSAASPAILDQPSAAIIVAAEHTLPTSPAAILATQTATPQQKRPVLLYGLAGLLAIQVFAPTEFKPGTIAGRVVATFTAPTLEEYTKNTVQLEQQRALATATADLEARRAEWAGNCALTGAFLPELGQACMALVNQRYEAALEQARRSLTRR